MNTKPEIQTSIADLPSARPTTDDEGRVILTEGRWMVGRGSSCQVVIQNPTVSRLHAYLAYSPAGLLVIDAGSRNGVYVNHERVSLSNLSPGDLVAFGSAEYLVGDAPLCLIRTFGSSSRADSDTPRDKRD